MSRPRWLYWSAAVVVATVGLGFLTRTVTVHGAELLATRSPDGNTEAVLIDVPSDAHGMHGAKVCFDTGRTPIRDRSSCTTIAYLAGVSGAQRNLGIRLVWQSPIELQVRYREASAVYLHTPVYFSRNVGSSRAVVQSYGSAYVPIHTRLIRENEGGEEVPGRGISGSLESQ